jgi:hypothetical protein
MHRIIAAVLGSCLLIVVALPLSAAEEPQLVFYGIVTVRDGKTVLYRNPELSDEQAKACAEAAGAYADLDRTFTTSKNDDGELTYTWGEEEGVLTEPGLVPYVACFVTPGEYISVEEAEGTPRVDAMTSSRMSTLDVAQVAWWAPETTKAVSVSLKYYDSSCYRRVVELKGDEIAAGAKGKSPDGVNWTIASVDRKAGEVVINVETDKGPEGHRFEFWIATKDWEEPRQDSPWTTESDDGSKLIYPVSRYVDDDDEVTSLAIRELHPDRMKAWSVKDFALETE